MYSSNAALCDSGRLAIDQRLLGLRAELEGADRHKIVSILLREALSSLRRGFFHLSEAPQSGLHGEWLSRSLKIIDGLMGSLDHEAAPELSANLARLYDYAIRSIIDANVKKNVGLLASATSVLESIEKAWSELRSENDLGVILNDLSSTNAEQSR